MPDKKALWAAINSGMLTGGSGTYIPATSTEYLPLSGGTMSGTITSTLQSNALRLNTEFGLNTLTTITDKLGTDLNSYLSANYATLANLTSYLTTAAASSIYLTMSSAAGTYATLTSLTAYVTTTVANATYLTITNAASTYVTWSALTTAVSTVTFDCTNGLINNLSIFNPIKLTYTTYPTPTSNQIGYVYNTTYGAGTVTLIPYTFPVSWSFTAPPPGKYLMIVTFKINIISSTATLNRIGMIITSVSGMTYCEQPTEAHQATNSNWIVEFRLPTVVIVTGPTILVNHNFQVTGNSYLNSFNYSFTRIA